MTRSTRQEDLVAVLCGLLVLFGLLLDGYYHATDPGLESFWTPWHAVFYAGFAMTAGWFGWMAVRRNPGHGNLLSWAPIGYRHALIGVGIFAVGGVGDAIWHSIFGVETSLDAVLSPTHLLLFTGLLAMLSAPFRAAWLEPRSLGAEESDPPLQQFAPALLSLTFTTAVVALFFFYTWGPIDTFTVRYPYVPGDGFSDGLAEATVIGAVASSTILFLPLLLACRRWQLPFGSATILVTVVQLSVNIPFGRDWHGLVAAIVAGLTFDVLVGRRVDRRLLAFVPPGVLWAVLFALVTTTDQGLQTAPEIWAGSIIMAALAVTGLDIALTLAAETGAAATPSVSSLSSAETEPPVSAGLDR